MRENAPLEQVDEKINAILERITIVEAIVPEFNSLVLLVLVTAIIPVILFSKVRLGGIRY
jgi:predicted secreted protein with PEFG-CTERM motif